MRIITFLLIFFIQWTHGQELNGSASSLSKHERKILKNFEAQVECWNNGDLDCYMEAYSQRDILQAVSRNGVTFDYDNILSNYKKYFPKGSMGQLSFQNFNFRKLTNRLYFVTGKFNLELEGREKPYSGWFSVILKRYGSKWFIITDHS